MTRRHDLDWVRVLAFALLVLYHVGMYYVTWEWHIDSPHASTALEPFMMLSSPWRLSLLFLVSGVATAFLLGKLRRQTGSPGVPARFLGQRSWRLLLPLAFGMLVVVVPQSYYEVVDKLPGGYHDGYLAFWARYLAGDGSFCRGGNCLAVPTWNHLWFVAYLWVYTVAIWLLVRMAPGTLDAAGRRLGGWLATPAVLLLAPALLLAGVRLLLVGRFASTHALVDDWYNHAQYFTVFALGFLIAREEGAWRGFVRLRWIALWLWLASWVAIAGYLELFRDIQPADGIRMPMRVVWALNQWCAIVAILGFARHLAPGDSPALRYLSQAVFPVYILHQTVIIVLAWHARPLGLPPLVEGPLLALLTFVLCLTAYEIIRRIGPLRPLFGLKRRGASAPAPVAGADAGQRA